MLADIAKDAATSAAPVQPARRTGSESTLRDVLGLAAVYAVADRLAQPEGQWKKFDRSGWKSLVFPDWRRS